MNKPSHPTPPFGVASPPYELDAYGWAAEPMDWGTILDTPFEPDQV